MIQACGYLESRKSMFGNTIWFTSKIYSAASFGIIVLSITLAKISCYKHKLVKLGASLELINPEQFYEIAMKDKINHE
jgi:hypothetical protein